MDLLCFAYSLWTVALTSVVRDHFWLIKQIVPMPQLAVNVVLGSTYFHKLFLCHSLSLPFEPLTTSFAHRAGAANELCERVAFQRSPHVCLRV